MSVECRKKAYRASGSPAYRYQCYPFSSSWDPEIHLNPPTEPALANIKSQFREKLVAMPVCSFDQGRNPTQRLAS